MLKTNSPLLCVLLLALTSAAQQSENSRWYDVQEFGVEGKGWTETKDFYDRLPAHAEGVVREPVWKLATNSAGMVVRFVTDSSSIAAQWSLRSERLALPHMPATGVSGLDLYVRDGERWHWLGTGRPLSTKSQQTLVSTLPRMRREYLLYLPLYNGVASLKVGVTADSVFEKPKVTPRKPIVFYGTSILQGGCASRPGMAYPAILGRWLDWPTINLGFSGNGKTEPEMARLLAELDPAVYVLDSLPNLLSSQVKERLDPFIDILRQAHPKTPIVLVENVIYADARFVESRHNRWHDSNAALAEIYKKRIASGDKHLFYIRADHLLGDDGEATVDGTHPTDLGFMRMAQTMEPIFRKLLPLHGATKR